MQLQRRSLKVAMYANHGTSWNYPVLIFTLWSLHNVISRVVSLSKALKCLNLFVSSNGSFPLRFSFREAWLEVQCFIAAIQLLNTGQWCKYGMACVAKCQGPVGAHWGPQSWNLKHQRYIFQ